MRRSHRRVRLAPAGIRPHSNRRAHGAQGARARRRARRRPSRGAGEVGDRAVCSTDSRPTPIEIPIPSAAANDALTRCGLPPDTFGARFPHELSGGQRQRVAIARALAARQSLVLLDESFSALDAISRSELLDTFADIRRALGFTAVLVTHDLGEAARFADSVAVMRAGRIEQLDTLHAPIEQPATPYVAQLVERARMSARLLVDA